MALIIVVNFSSSSSSDGLRQRGTNSSQMLAYDRSAPFDLKETSTREQDGAVIKDVNYAAYASRHGRINAFLVKPKGAGPFAGIVFFHWLGKPKGDRTQFLDEAVALSKKRVVSLLIQGFFPWTEQPTDEQRIGNGSSIRQ